MTLAPVKSERVQLRVINLTEDFHATPMEVVQRANHSPVSYSHGRNGSNQEYGRYVEALSLLSSNAQL